MVGVGLVAHKIFETALVLGWNSLGWDSADFGLGVVNKGFGWFCCVSNLVIFFFDFHKNTVHNLFSIHIHIYFISL